MNLLASILVLALSRAEILERLRMPPVSQLDGLVKVYADCPEDMRREYQLPVASFAADVCRAIQRGRGDQLSRFASAGVVIRIGEVRTNVTDVLVRTDTRADGSPVTFIYLPAPGHADPDRLRIETAKAYGRCVAHAEWNDAAAFEAVCEGDAELRVVGRLRKLARWRAGEDVGADDEQMLKLARSILVPGTATSVDAATFASRLVLYPPTYDTPFAGRYVTLDFRDAIVLRKDVRVRLAACLKANELIVYGGGRGDGLAAAASAYATFLRELARGKLSDAALAAILDAADAALKSVWDDARKREEAEAS